MVPVIQKVWQQAVATFSKNGIRNPNFSENLSHLHTLMNQVTAAEVCLSDDVITKEKYSENSVLAPVTYIHIYEDSDISMGIFVLKPGTRLPLHDHPGMHGILKVVHGHVRIQSYTVQSKLSSDFSEGVHSINKGYGQRLGRGLVADKHPQLKLEHTDPACVLTPTERNLHEIQADTCAAFLDVLAPPYHSDNCAGPGPDKNCHYFKEMTPITNYSESKRNFMWLAQIPSPSDFWCDTALYRGPPLQT